MPKENRQLYIGTSGWNYKAWKDTFYKGVKQKEWLQHYATKFNAVEVNATFYRLLKESTVQGWDEKTPEGFSFAVKGSRYISHTKKLKPDPDSVGKQRDNLKPLGEKSRAVLWQAPGSLQKDLDVLQEFGKKLADWPGVEHVLEFRHESWFDQETAKVMHDLNLGNCISDSGKWPRWDQVTGSVAYVRLHGAPETYVSAYSDEELQQWAEKIKNWINEGKTVHIYFDNTDQGAAADNALTLQGMLLD
jgi:uncharacterized protein YecE (DUF72 family)